MSMLYTLIYPNISREDSSWIESFRRAHDPQCEILPAHFTMVFGGSAVEEDAYMDHIADVARSAVPIEFCCRYAMLGVDGHSERGYVYLVPDEGYSGLSRLHDDLYQGVLAEQLRLDIPFIPHITLGTTAERSEAKQLCDELNSSSLIVHGVLDTLTVATLKEHKIVPLAELPFSG